MNKLITSLFTAIIEEMYKLFKLGKDTDSMLRSTIKKTIVGLTLAMMLVAFLAMGHRLIKINQELLDYKASCEAQIHQSKNQPNAPSDSALDAPNQYSLSSKDSHCADSYCRRERHMSMSEGLHGIKIRNIND